jgi:hypothetical protein
MSNLEKMGRFLEVSLHINVSINFFLEHINYSPDREMLAVYAGELNERSERVICFTGEKN